MTEIQNSGIDNDYVAVKALSEGVQIIGLTRGDNTKPHHTENIDRGEVLIIQFTEKTSAIKIRGRAKVYTKFGVIESGD